MHYDYPGEDIREKSVKAMQRLIGRNGVSLAIDGDLGDLTMNHLRMAPIEGFEVALAPRTLKLTEPQQSGRDVIALQEKLGIKADGVYGNSTKSAVKAWQSAQGLTSDGVIGVKSRGLIGIA
jgi:peptidoglycan hydrolase-like protein with peptidoglycan-binding domain